MNNDASIHPTKLSPKAIREIIIAQAEAYCKASRAEKSVILDNLQAVTWRNKKSLIRTLNNTHKRQAHSRNPLTKQPGRPRIYTNEAIAALVEVWEIYNHICTERLHPQINAAIDILQRDRMWPYSTEATNLLRQMKSGTMKYYLVKTAKDKGLMRGISATRSSDVLSQVPIFHGDWSNMPLGCGQIDTVVHSGPRLEGVMAYTVSFIEMQTYWQEFGAQLGKTAETTRDTVSHLIQRIPFVIAGIHSDTGNEFVNEVLIRWCRRKQINFTRSRPYEKNDNCNVEERNRSIVRHFIGFGRYDCQAAVDAMNELYATLRLYVNYFQPIMKIAEKTRLPSGHYIRKYDLVKTPYERVLAREDIPLLVKQRLMAEYATLNPKHLRDTIQALTIKLERIQKQAGYHF